MNLVVAELTASLTPRPLQRPGDLTSREIMRRLLDLGYQTLVLAGALIDDFSAGVPLFVEEDAHLLLHYYSYFEDLLEKAQSYEFDTVLSDGLLDFSTVSDRATVHVEFRFTPGLNVGNLVAYSTTLTEQEYTWWWRSIAAGLLSLARLPRQ